MKKIKITLHLEGTADQVAQQALDFVATLQPTPNSEAGLAVSAGVGKGKRGKKKEEPEEEFSDEVPEESEESTEESENEEEEELEEEETEDEDSEESEEETAGATLPEVRAAFHDFTKKDDEKGTKTKAAYAVMKQFGVKSLLKLKPNQFRPILAALAKVASSAKKKK